MDTRLLKISGVPFNATREDIKYFCRPFKPHVIVFRPDILKGVHVFVAFETPTEAVGLLSACADTSATKKCGLILKHRFVQVRPVKMRELILNDFEEAKHLPDNKLTRSRQMKKLLRTATNAGIDNASLLNPVTTLPLREDIECPITMTLLEDPVMLVGDNSIYSRDSITAWLQKNKTSPLHGSKLDTPAELALIPLPAIAAKVERYRAAYPDDV